PFPRAARSESSNLPSGIATSRSLTVLSDGLSSSESQAKRGLVELMTIMGGSPEDSDRVKRAHASHYAMDTRNVGALVEKPEKTHPCDAKCRKIRAFFGDRLRKSNRDPSLIHDLRTEQPPHTLEDTFQALRVSRYNLRTTCATCPGLPIRG